MLHRTLKCLAALLAGVLLVSLLGACEKSDTHDGETGQGSGEGTYPSWTEQQGGPIVNGDEKVFYGSGYARGIRNSSLLRATADNRARLNLSGIMYEYTNLMLKDYKQDISAGDRNRIKMISGNGIEIVDHWQDNKTGKLYARARIELSMYKHLIEIDSGISSHVREHILRNADLYYAKLIQHQSGP